MEISIDIPLDGEGFLRRECPACLGQFKWFVGPTDATPADWQDPDEYHCPYCGAAAGPDAWWTQEQLDYVQAVGAGAVHEQVVEELEHMARRSANDFIKLEVTADPPPEPARLFDPPDDMDTVEPPCHPFEPLKVRLAVGVVHCLICGNPFTVAA